LTQCISVILFVSKQLKVCGSYSLACAKEEAKCSKQGFYYLNGFKINCRDGLKFSYEMFVENDNVLNTLYEEKETEIKKILIQVLKDFYV
jgi:hypothetical protein